MSIRFLYILSLALLPACQFSASASGKVETGGEAEGDASATMEESPTPEPEPDTSIVYREGKLDYEGVINFEYNKAQLRSTDKTEETLEEFKAFLETHPQVNIEIEGHTDSRGSDDYNRRLSDRRAASVRAWLVEHGISEDRLTAIGKGEDEPQQTEPPECDDQVPEDTSPCELAWAANRRVVFEVTAGGESLPEAEPVPEPVLDPEPVFETEPEVVEAPPECPWLFGGHLNALGPNSWVMLAGAIQPGVCWLEPSLGVGVGFGGIEADNPDAGTSAEGDHLSFTIPLRARFWFMDRHSLIGDLGLGLSLYSISAELDDASGNIGEYSRDSTNFLGHAGLGYGFRPNGGQAGFRLGIVVGGLLHFNDLADSSTDLGDGFDAAVATDLQNRLDGDSDGLTDFEPYGEISLGLLF